MKTNIAITITSSEDAKKFLSDLITNNEHFHPDDNAKDIVTRGENGEQKLFTKKEAKQVDKLLGDCFEFADFCIYGFMIDFERDLELSKIVISVSNGDRRGRHKSWSSTAKEFVHKYSFGFEVIEKLLSLEKGKQILTHNPQFIVSLKN